MKILNRGIAVIAAVLTVSGCARFNQGYSAASLDYKTDDTESGYSLLYTDISNKIGKRCLYPPTAGDTSWGSECKTARVIVLGDLLAISNTLCTVHTNSILGKEAQMNIITGSLTNVFSGTATVVGGEAAKAVFAALAGISNSERSLINETVYKTTVAPAVVTKINEGRSEIHTEVLKKISSDDDYGKYPINMGVSDILQYHDRCSFTYGLTRALSEGTQDVTAITIGKLEQRRTMLVGQLAALRTDGQPEVKAAYVAELKAVSEKLSALVTGTGK